MARASVTWVQGKQFIGVDSTSHSVVMSSPAEGIGMKPSDLLLVGLGGCTAYDIVNILEKRRKPLSRLEVTVEGEQEKDPPWTFRKIHIHYLIAGENLTPAEVEKAIHQSEEKYCSVSATVKGAAEITTSFELLGAPEPA